MSAVATASAVREGLMLLSPDAPSWWLDELIGLAKAARELPGTRGSQHMHPSAILRLIQANRLRAVKCGRRFLTCRRWLLEMLQRDAGAHAQAGTLSARTKLQGDKAADAAARRQGYEIGEGN